MSVGIGAFSAVVLTVVRLPVYHFVSPLAGEVWYAASVMAAILLWGLAIFFFVFGIIPWWFKLHKRLDEILSCRSSLSIYGDFLPTVTISRLGANLPKR